MRTLPATGKQLPTSTWRVDIKTVERTPFSPPTGYGEIYRHDKKVGAFEESRENNPTRTTFTTPTHENLFTAYAEDTLTLNGRPTRDPIHHLIRLLVTEHITRCELGRRINRVPYVPAEQVTPQWDGPLTLRYLTPASRGEKKLFRQVGGHRLYLIHLYTRDRHQWDATMAGKLIWDAGKWQEPESIIRL